ncbi:MAG: hypothetical protein IPK76_01830 [Lewinellaceae bacterium]|nr:hypothetical protein [Lewinellaceae bacterium]
MAAGNRALPGGVMAPDMVVFRVTFLLCCFIGSMLPAQTSFFLRIDSAEQSAFYQNIGDFRLIPVGERGEVAEFRLPDSSALQPFCLDLLRHFYQKSYLAASIDSLNAANALFHLGPAMRWVRRPSANPENDAWLQSAGFRENVLPKSRCGTTFCWRWSNACWNRQRTTAIPSRRFGSTVCKWRTTVAYPVCCGWSEIVLLYLNN